MGNKRNNKQRWQDEAENRGVLWLVWPAEREGWRRECLHGYSCRDHPLAAFELWHDAHTTGARQPHNWRFIRMAKALQQCLLLQLLPKQTFWPWDHRASRRPTHRRLCWKFLCRVLQPREIQLLGRSNVVRANMEWGQCQNIFNLRVKNLYCELERSLLRDEDGRRCVLHHWFIRWTFVWGV